MKDVTEHPDFAEVVRASNFLQDKLKNTRCKQFLKVFLKMNEDSRLGVSMGCITRWGSHFVQYAKQLNWKTDIQALTV